MSAVIDMENPAMALKIDGEMTIYRAAELKALLMDVAEANRDCELDLSEVAEIDCAGVQLLLAAVCAARKRGRTLRLAAYSQPVGATLEALGLESLLRG